MEKSLYAAPQGLASMVDDNEPDFEIQIEDPEAVHIKAGGVEIDLEPGDENETEDLDFSENLAESMDEGELGSIAQDIIEMVDADINSRKDWVDMYVKGLDVLGVRYEERTEPWNGASGVFSTLLTESAVRFQSETIIETFPAAGPVKTEVIGNETPEKLEAADRVSADMNYMLTEKMVEYRPEHERMLFNLGLAGSAFKKIYYDTHLERPMAIFVPAEELIIPYGSSNIRSAERVTHIMRKTKNELKKLQVSGFYRDVELGEPTQTHTDIEKRKADEQGYSLSDDERYQFLEVNIEYELPGFEDDDGIALPYVITIDKGTQKVLAIRRNWDKGDPNCVKRNHFVQYDYVPGFGAYGFGFIHLIGGYARAGTSLIRQLIDAGTLANLPGGLKARGLRVKGDDTPIQPGEFRDVDIPSGAIKDNIMPLPYKEPSQVLAALLDKITQEARRLGATADLNVSDMSAGAPVGTTLALLERQLKTMSAVQARVHYAMKQEFKLLKDIIREDTPKKYSYDPVGADPRAKQSDYDMVAVIPVSDPNSSTMAQRIMQYQAVLQLSQGAPQIYDLPFLHRQMIQVLGVKNGEKIVPLPDDQKPKDPVSENMAILTGKPTKAFMYQDHDAHLAVHQTMMQDPVMQAQIGQSPQAQAIMGAAMAHVMEHMAFKYRTMVEQQLGAPLPTPDAEMSPEIEVQVSKLVAQASAQVLAQNKGQAAQAQAQQQMQDPLIQMQQAELKIKQQQAQTAAQKVQGDLQIKQQELQIKAGQAQAQAQTQQAQAQTQQAQAPNPMIQNLSQVQDMAHKQELHKQTLAHNQANLQLNQVTQAANHNQQVRQNQTRHIQDVQHRESQNKIDNMKKMAQVQQASEPTKKDQ
jgi:hypothetical protein